MKEINYEKVKQEYILRQENNPNPKNINYIEKRFIRDFPKNNIKFYDTEISKDSHIVNTRFNELLGITKTQEETITLEYLKKLYIENKLDSKHKENINSIIKNYDKKQKILIEMIPENQYSIYDGWHMALACLLMEKDIPAYLAIKIN